MAVTESNADKLARIEAKIDALATQVAAITSSATPEATVVALIRKAFTWQ